MIGTDESDVLLLQIVFLKAARMTKTVTTGYYWLPWLTVGWRSSEPFVRLRARSINLQKPLSYLKRSKNALSTLALYLGRDLASEKEQWCTLELKALANNMQSTMLLP